MRFVVTGTGHCGTAWMSRALTWLGHPCGHEWVYGFDSAAAGSLWGGLHGDSSLTAPAHMEHLDGMVPILTVVRDPLAVVSSIMGEHLFALSCDCHERDAHLKSPFGQFVKAHYPWAWGAQDELGRAIRWVAGWNQFIQQRQIQLGLTGMTVRIEDLSGDPQRMVEAVGFLTGRRPDPELVREVSAALGVRVNSHAKASLAWEDLRANPEGHLIVAHATKFGYL